MLGSKMDLLGCSWETSGSTTVMLESMMVRSGNKMGWLGNKKDLSGNMTAMLEST